MFKDKTQAKIEKTSKAFLYYTFTKSWKNCYCMFHKPVIIS